MTTNPPGWSGRDVSVTGPVGMIVTIIAARCNDEGACITCYQCGHIFAESVPLSDESEQVKNTDLARELWTHMCDQPDRKPRRPVANTRTRKGR